jgi:hypothetical protein
MPKISEEAFKKKRGTVSAMQAERQPFWQHWRELANYVLPQRYIWLLSGPEQRINRRNSMILDSTGTKAARTLASGMMNGITSPARPWFKLRITGVDFNDFPEAAVWTQEVEKRMLRVMAESNFYNSMAVLYLDLVVFGTAASIIYESNDKTIHCFNPALGEFYLSQSSEHRVTGIAREFEYTVAQLVQEFDLENCSDKVKNAYREGGARLLERITIFHLIEPNNHSSGYAVSKSFNYVECYWEKGSNDGMLLRQRGYTDFPAITPRWELSANDCYGSSPAMDALPDIIQLQHETKKKAQALDKMVSPPLLADVTMEHRPMALLPNGVTFVPRLDSSTGARPIYTVNPPIGEMSADIRSIQARIAETFHNELFQMISQLDTVRSATEIDARREEKLVLLGPVLERFENEALDPAIQRIYGIMDRRGLLPEVPQSLADIGGELEIQYVSILSSAQSAVGTAPIERLLQVIGNVAGIWPEARLVPNIPELLQEYAVNIGVQQKNLHTRDQVGEMINAQNQTNEQNAGMEQAQQGAGAAKLLSETDVGGGANALQRLLGSAGA